jgi:hypothetical protein
MCLILPHDGATVSSSGRGEAVLCQHRAFRALGNSDGMASVRMGSAGSFRMPKGIFGSIYGLVCSKPFDDDTDKWASLRGANAGPENTDPNRLCPASCDALSPEAGVSKVAIDIRCDIPKRPLS